MLPSRLLFIRTVQEASSGRAYTLARVQLCRALAVKIRAAKVQRLRNHVRLAAQLLNLMVLALAFGTKHR